MVLGFFIGNDILSSQSIDIMYPLNERMIRNEEKMDGGFIMWRNAF